MKTEQLTCISCPRGCSLQVCLPEEGASGAAANPDKNLQITGNYCPSGIDYARQEILAPQRVLTCLCWPEGAKKPVSVKTDRPVPKAQLLACAREIYRTHPSLPIHSGDVLAEDLCGTGARVIATRDGDAR